MSYHNGDRIPAVARRQTLCDTHGWEKIDRKIAGNYPEPKRVPLPLAGKAELF